MAVGDITVGVWFTVMSPTAGVLISPISVFTGAIIKSEVVAVVDIVSSAVADIAVRDVPDVDSKTPCHRCLTPCGVLYVLLSVVVAEELKYKSSKISLATFAQP